MTRRRVIWMMVVLVAGTAVVLLTPGSPLYLGDWRARRAYGGRTHTDWVKDLTRPEAEARYEACRTLGMIGADAADAAPALAEVMLKDEDRVVRGEASLALSKMAPAATAVVPQLGQALADPFPLVRLNAAMTLSRLRTAARPAVPALITALAADGNDTNLNTFTFSVREMIALALGRASAGTGDGVPALSAALDRAQTDSTRRAVAQALGEVGPPAVSAASQLRTLLASPNADVRQTAEWALQQVEPGSPSGR